jgi:hypothetical protein
MSTYKITSSDDALPTLSLPSGSRPASHSDYDHDVDTDPPEIEPIEHRLRVDFIDGGPVTLHEIHGPGEPRARQHASKTLTDQYQREQQYYAKFPDSEVLEQAPAFLQDELEPHYEALRDIQQRRLDWYTDHIPRNLDEVLKTVESLCAENSPNNVFVDANTYRGVVLVPNETDAEEYAANLDLHPVNVINETELDDHTSPSEYGINLPAPILTGEYGSQSWYSLIPWSDGLVCGCPYKQRRPWRAMCKHELVSSIILGHKNQYLLPISAGIEVPQRARRFLNPTIASRHTPTLPKAD